MNIDPALCDRNHGSSATCVIDVVLPTIEANMTITQADAFQLKHGTSAGRKFSVVDIYQQLVQFIDAKISADLQKTEYDHNPVSVFMETISLTEIATSMRIGPLVSRMKLISSTRGQKVMTTFLEKTAMLTTEAFIDQNGSVRDMINKALKHCMTRPPGHRVVHSADPYLDPKMLLVISEIRREFAPTALVSNSLEKVIGETWKKTID